MQRRKKLTTLEHQSHSEEVKKAVSDVLFLAHDNLDARRMLVLSRHLSTFASNYFMPLPPAVTRQNLQAFPVVSFSYSRGCREAQTRPRHTSPRAPRPVCSPPLMQTFRTSTCEQFTPRTAHFSDLHPFPRRRADTRETRWPKFWTTQQILTPTSERWIQSRHASCSSLDICTLLRRPAAVFLRRKCLMTLYGL